MPKKEPQIALGDFIKEIREASGSKDQVEFAKRLSVSPSYVSKLESGQATPSAEMLLLLVRDFGADADKARRLFAAVQEQDVDERWKRAAARVGLTTV